jgi:hypothetical protein
VSCRLRSLSLIRLDRHHDVCVLHDVCEVHKECVVRVLVAGWAPQMTGNQMLWSAIDRAAGGHTRGGETRSRFPSNEV